MNWKPLNRDELMQESERLKPEMMEFTDKLRNMGFSYLCIIAAFRAGADCLRSLANEEMFNGEDGIS